MSARILVLSLAASLVAVTLPAAARVDKAPFLKRHALDQLLLSATGEFLARHLRGQVA